MSILQKVSAFNNFTEGDDPYGEHDFGVIEGMPRVYWKIDYYADENSGCRRRGHQKRVSRLNNHVGGGLLTEGTHGQHKNGIN